MPRYNFTKYPVAILFTLGAVLLAGCHRSASSPPAPRISLRVIYQDTETLSAETVVNGQKGATTELHSGTATYVFKNELPIPLKLAFPPIGYAGGGLVPITPQVNDVKKMPTFCQKQQIVTLPPMGEKSFESSYTFTGSNLVEHFVFGCPSEGVEDGIFVGEVVSTPEMHPKQGK